MSTRTAKRSLSINVNIGVAVSDTDRKLGYRHMDIVELAQLAELHQLQYERSLLELLDGLQVIDPEVAEQAIHVFDDRTGAAAWLASPVRSLGGVTPLQALAEGRREDVLRVLHQILYGVYG